ncbi:MAG: cytochrome o ubiquinol oxidase subunit IV [Pseudomonadota bacterium]
MSETTQETDQDHGSHGSYRSYLIGFGLSVVLTVIPFWVVMSGSVNNAILAIGIIFALGAAQILVHIYYFLHVTLKAEDGWQAMSIAFTAIILVIVLAGSIWVMFHLHENMMPAHEQIERVRNLP